MSLEDLIAPKERVRVLMVVALPAAGLLEGFVEDEWTTVETFDREGDAKTRLHSITRMLGSFKARAFLIRETDPGVRNRMVSWRTLVRCNDPETYLEPEDVVNASPLASASWREAVEAFLAPAPPVAKPPPPSRVPQAIAASVVLVVGMAIVGLIVAFPPASPPVLRIAVDDLNEFARKGGVLASFPDENRAGWYVRVRINPNGSVELLGRFPAEQLEARQRNGELVPEHGSRLDAKLGGIAAALKSKI